MHGAVEDAVLEPGAAASLSTMSQVDAPHRASPPPSRAVRLRAGVPVLGRGDGLVQVGTDPARRVLLPDTSSVRRLLQLLPFGVRTDAPASNPEVLRALAAAGLLVDEDDVRLLAEARAATRVRLDAPGWWRPLVTGLVAAAGLATTDADRQPADVTLVLTWGEPDRDELDQLTARDQPWLPVAVLEGRVRVGPFVVPGASACLRCTDAHASAADPWHRVPPAPDVSLLVRTPGDGADEQTPPPDAVDALVLHHGLLTAVTDVSRWAEGRQPLTWSATRTHRSGMTVEHRAWTRHPHCGCSWGDDVATA